MASPLLLARVPLTIVGHSSGDSASRATEPLTAVRIRRVL